MLGFIRSLLTLVAWRREATQRITALEIEVIKLKARDRTVRAIVADEIARAGRPKVSRG